MLEASIPTFVGGIPGGPELLVILLIAILLFGANKIPKLARSSGEAIGEFQKGREEVEQELEQMREGATGGTSTDTAGTDTASTDTASTDTATDAAATETTADAGTETTTETSTEGTTEDTSDATVPDAETEEN